MRSAIILRPAHYAGLTALLCMHVMVYENSQEGAACHSAETKLISTLTSSPILQEPRARARPCVRVGVRNISSHAWTFARCIKGEGATMTSLLSFHPTRDFRNRTRGIVSMVSVFEYG